MNITTLSSEPDLFENMQYYLPQQHEIQENKTEKDSDDDITMVKLILFPHIILVNYNYYFGRFHQHHQKIQIPSGIAVIIMTPKILT